MASFDYIDSINGVLIPDTSDVLNQVILEFQAALGTDIVTDPSTPQGALIALIAQERIAVIQNNAQLANQINPNIAGGVFLDALWALLGGQRTPASFSQVVATVAGAPGTVIPTSAVAVTTSGDQFSPFAPITIPSSGSTTGEFQAVAAGAIAIPAGSLTGIQSGVLGWETVNNLAAGTVGGPVQSDQQVRVDRLNTLALNSVALPEAIISGLFGANIGVTSVGFQENFTNSTVTIKGVSMAPHSIYVCVTNGAPLNYMQGIESFTGTAGLVIEPQVPQYQSVSALTSAVLVGGISYTATATVTSTGGFKVGDSISIAGASPAQYNGNFTIATIPNGTTLTYTIDYTGSLASSATGTISFFDNSQTTQMQVSDGTNVFNLIETVYLGSSGTGGGTIQAVATGTPTVAANTITTIITPVNGLTGVTNTYPTTAYTETFLTQVATVLLEKKSAGAAWSTGPGTAPYGPQNINVVEPASQQTYLVSFDTPTPVPILMQAYVTVLPTFIGDPVAAVQASVLAFAAGQVAGFEGFAIGETVSVFDISAAVAAQNPGLQITNFLTTLASSISFATTPISIAIYQQAVIQTSSINVIATS